MPQGWERVLGLTITAILTVLMSHFADDRADLSWGKEKAVESRFIALEAHRQTILYYEEKLAACEEEE
jgi:hypothetical protein